MTTYPPASPSAGPPPRRGWRLPAVVATAVVSVAAASAVALAGTVESPSTSAAPVGGVPGVQVPTIAWKDAGDGYQRATVAVPYDYTDPGGRQLNLAVVRLPATDEAHKLGALFVNFGGPGAPAAATLRASGTALFPADVRARYDLIGVDPPGTGDSTPITCTTGTAEQTALSLSGQLDFPAPDDPAEQAKADDQARTFAAGCEERSGDLLRHVGTLRFARDLDVLRAAVGSERINLYGYSYGTILGQVVANVFPERAGAIVLDGVVGPEWFDGPAGSLAWTRVGSDIGTSETLAEFFRRCDAAGTERCAFAGKSRRAYARLAARLRKSPVTVTTGDSTDAVDYPDLVTVTQSLLFQSAAWPVLGQALEELSKAAFPESTAGRRRASAAAGRALRWAQRSMREFPGAVAVDTTAGAGEPSVSGPGAGEPNAVEPSAAQTGAGESSAGESSAAETGAAESGAAEAYNNYADANWAITCADTVNPKDPAVHTRVGVERDRTVAPYFGSRWASVTRPCAFWTASATERWTGPWNQRTATPVLVVGTRWDPATPYRNAVAASKLLPNSALLTVDGVGHTSLGSGTCVNDAVSRYLLTGAVPAAGTVCGQDRGPFDPQTAGEAAQQ